MQKMMIRKLHDRRNVPGGPGETAISVASDYPCSDDTIFFIRTKTFSHGRKYGRIGKIYIRIDYHCESGIIFFDRISDPEIVAGAISSV